MKFKNEEIGDVTGKEFSSFFKKKYPDIKIISLVFAVEFYFNEDDDDLINSLTNEGKIEKICTINCSSIFGELENFELDFRSFSGENFQVCFNKFKFYFDGMYNVYLLEKNNPDHE